MNKIPAGARSKRNSKNTERERERERAHVSKTDNVAIHRN